MPAESSGGDGVPHHIDDDGALAGKSAVILTRDAGVCGLVSDVIAGLGMLARPVESLDQLRALLAVERVHVAIAYPVVPRAIGDELDDESLLALARSSDDTPVIVAMRAGRVSSRLAARTPRRPAAESSLISVGRLDADALRRTLIDALSRSSSRGLRVRRRSKRMQAVTPAPELRILVVEDNPINRQVAELMLERLGYRGEVAVNGAEAVAAVCRAPYDLVLMDIQMPEMDGLEATRRIRTMCAENRQPRVIAMTALGGSHDRARIMAAGADGYLGKPLRIEELSAEITRLLSARG